MRPFNSMFITEKDKTKPIWYYDISGGELKIDIHVQAIDFELTTHQFILSAKTQDGQELLADAKFLFDANTQLPEFKQTNSDSAFGAGEFTFFIEMDKNDIKKSGNYITIHVKMEEEQEGTFVLYLAGGQNG